MKFHQAYYTWDWEQLTKYQGGLGIHASSCKNIDFLNHCMKLGARLKPEPVNETAEFLLYSEELGYVGAFISPREDVSGKNRANMLCHLFAAADKTEEINLNDYLVEYPYHIHMKENLEPVSCSGIQSEKDKYYNQLLRKYSFTKEKMAVLIWRIYQRLYDKLTKIPMVFSREIHPDRQKDGEIGRELTWLMYQLAPEKEFKEKRWYDKLTYGVHTEANRKEISLYYTDENIWNNAFCIDEEMEIKKEEIPPIFLKMGELACSCGNESGISCLQKFIEALRQDSKQELLSYEQLDFLFERWKMKNGWVVEEDYIRSHLDELWEQSYDSFLHKEYLYTALTKVESSNRVFLRNLWLKIIYEQRDRFETMVQEEKKLYQQLAFSLLHKMQEVNQEDFAIALNSLPDESRQDILEKYMDENAGFILEDLDSMEDMETFKAAALKYGVLASKFPVVIDKIIAFAKDCYEGAAKAERENLSDFMNDRIRDEALQDAWLVYQKQWLSARNTDILAFLEKQKGRIEERYIDETYEFLISYGERLESKNERVQDFLRIEKEYLQENREFISEKSILQMEDMKRNWTIAREVNRLKQADMKTLLEKTLKELQYEECYKQWFKRAVELLGDFRTNLGKDEFIRLLKFRTEGWELFDQEKTEEWKDFDKQLRKQLSRFYADFSWRVLYYTCDPADQVNEIWSYITLDYESFLLCSRIFEKFPENGEKIRKAAGNKRESCKKSYLLWEKVKKGTKIDYESLDQVSDDQYRQLMSVLEKTMLEKEAFFPVDLINLCLLLYFRFSWEDKTYKSLYRKAGLYQRLYQSESLCSLLRQQQEVFQVKMNLKVPQGKILDELVIFLEKWDLEKENRQGLQFYRTADFLRSAYERFGKEEMEKVHGINDMYWQLEKALYDTELVLKQSRKRKGDCMSALERLEMEKARLLNQLEECEKSIKEKKLDLEENHKKEQMVKQEYIKQCEALSKEPKAELVERDDQSAETPVVKEPVIQEPVQEEKMEKNEESEGPDLSEYYVYGEDII